MRSAPVLFIVFNRPDTTRLVFERIREARPEKLYVAADGPRSTKPGEAELCGQVRDIVEQVDWPCEVNTRYLKENAGCRNAVSSAISWFFEQEEMGIILEDDCLPHPSFFGFALECLLKYKDDARVMHINGSNYLDGFLRDKAYSYYFSHYNSIWGWASWRRAWKFYNAAIPLWPEFKKKGYIHDVTSNRMQAITVSAAFDSVYQGRMDTWDFQWTFTLLSQSGLTIIPAVNLISNIGFGDAATHTTQKVKRANMPQQAISLPLKHPPFMVADTVNEMRHFNLHMKRGYTWRLKHWRELFFSK